MPGEDHKTLRRIRNSDTAAAKTFRDQTPDARNIWRMSGFKLDSSLPYSRDGRADIKEMVRRN